MAGQQQERRQLFFNICVCELRWWARAGAIHLARPGGRGPRQRGHVSGCVPAVAVLLPAGRCGWRARPHQHRAPAVPVSERGPGRIAAVTMWTAAAAASALCTRSTSELARRPATPSCMHSRQDCARASSASPGACYLQAFLLGDVPNCAAENTFWCTVRSQVGLAA